MACNTTVRLDDELNRKVDALAASLDRSRPWVIEEAIRQYLEHQDWILRQVDEERIRQNAEPSAPIETTDRVRHLTGELVVSGLPYIVTYRVKPDRLELLNVRHVSRRSASAAGYLLAAAAV